jgi:transposase
MRGRQDRQQSMLGWISIEARIPSDHPLRRIKKMADQELVGLSRVFERMYSNLGRPSVAPEKILKSLLLIGLYSVRSERQFCEQLGYNLLFRWFLDMELIEESFDATVFSKNRERLMQHEVGRLFFEAVVKQAREAELMSDDHFTVDGTVIEAWAASRALTHWWSKWCETRKGLMHQQRKVDSIELIMLMILSSVLHWLRNSVQLAKFLR